jgi:hypothetical protein
MVLIPNDAGIRMRMQTETALHPIAPVSEIPADLAELHPGQTFSARIQEILPENTYKALVAGRSLTLALPEGAKTGDTLELVVIDRTPRLIVAQLANRNGATDAAAAADYQFTNLSRTAQLIGALLARDGAPPPAAELNRGTAAARRRVPRCSQAGRRSCAATWRKPSRKAACSTRHQVQWIMGQRPVSDLQAEPQAKHAPAPLAATGQESGGAATSGHPARPSARRICPDRWCCCKTFSAAMKLASRPGPAGADRQSGACGAGGTPPPGAAATGCRRHPAHGLAWRSLAGPVADWQIEPDGRRDPMPGPRTRNEAGPRRCVWSRRAWEKSTRGSA